ncbi:hypothetical protein DOY81_001979, partial [Sarcophaga bullata]
MNPNPFHCNIIYDLFTKQSTKISKHFVNLDAPYKSGGTKPFL